MQTKVAKLYILKYNSIQPFDVKYITSAIHSH